MSTETTQDNFAGMTAEQKIKALILIRGRVQIDLGPARARLVKVGL